MFSNWWRQSEKLVADTRAAIERDERQREQSREKLVADFAAGRVTKPEQLRELLAKHAMTLDELVAAAEMYSQLEADRATLAELPTHEQTLRDCVAERDAIHETLTKELAAARLKSRQASILVDQREQDAQRALTRCHEARVRVLQSAKQSGAIRAAAEKAATAGANYLNDPACDWLAEQRRLTAHVDALQTEIACAVSASGKAHARERLVGVQAELDRVEAYIRDRKQTAEHYSQVAQSLEAEALGQ